MALHAESWIERIARVLANAGAACTIAMLVLICADVFSRTLFNQPLAAVNEIVSNWLMVGLVFLPLGIVGAQRQHIEVEMVASALPPIGRRVLFRIGRALTAIVLTLLVYAAIGPALTATRIGESTAATLFDLPVWPVRWALLAACAAAVLVELRRMFGPDGADV